MLSHLTTQLIRSLGIFFRTIRAFFNRKLVGIWARLRRLTNFSRQATKVASDSLQSAAAITKPPATRKDYLETGQLFISKRLILMVIVGLVLFALVAYFVIWPFILAHFFTARFFVEDSRIDTWAGRAIVYSDEAKTLPLYEGKLQDGVLQGKGKEYDENGVLTYEGAFVDGMREGTGIAYEGGAMVYEGDFSVDLYDGTGKLYDSGEFIYEGAFKDGVRSGEGTEFYSIGRPRYKGAFADDLYEGQGVEYDEKGAKLYEGGFSQGLYNGAGSLYPLKDQRVEATFVDGEPDGAIQWYKSNKLYYDGEADGLTPSGFGMLYTQNGKTAYIGKMSNGTVDGSWLLTLSADEFREALGDCEAVDYSDVAGGFVISSPSLGLSALCSYQTTDSEPAVRSVFVSEPRTPCFELLPGGDWVTFTDWPTPTTRERQYIRMKGVNTNSGLYDSEVYELADCRAEVLRSDGTAVLLSWSKTESAGTTSSAGSDAADGSESGNTKEDKEEQQKKLEGFLESLDLMAGTDAASGAAEEQARLDETLAELGLAEKPKQEAGENPYYGETEITDALKDCSSASDTAKAVDAMLDYWQTSEKRAALESNLSRTLDLLTEAQNAVASGQGSQDTVAMLESERDKLENQINNCMVEQTKASTLAKDAGAKDPEDCKLPGLAVTFNPAEMKVDELALIATAYAQMKGTENEDISISVKNILADLMTAYNDLQGALSACDAAKAASDTAAGAYATGAGSRSDWYDAQSAQSDAQSAVYDAICTFTHRANELNSITGGWVSRTEKWMTDTFDPLYPKVEVASTDKPKEQAASTDKSKDQADQEAQTEQAAPPAEQPSSTEEQTAPPEQGTTVPEEAETEEAAPTISPDDPEA